MLDPLTRAVLRSIACLVLGLVMLIAVLAPSGAETMPINPRSASPHRAARHRPSRHRQRRRFKLADPSATLLSWVADTQQSMQRELAASVKRLKSGNAIGAAIALAGLSFLYGVVHAIGPGHGKTIISSYVVANEETVRRGVIISFIAAGLQALTAVVLVGVLAHRVGQAPGLRSMPGRTSSKA